MIAWGVLRFSITEPNPDSDFTLTGAILWMLAEVYQNAFRVEIAYETDRIHLIELKSFIVDGSRARSMLLLQKLGRLNTILSKSVAAFSLCMQSGFGSCISAATSWIGQMVTTNTFLFWQAEHARMTRLRLRKSELFASQTACMLIRNCYSTNAKVSTHFTRQPTTRFSSTLL